MGLEHGQILLGTLKADLTVDELLRALTPQPTGILINQNGSGLSCLHCAGKGYLVSSHPIPWLSTEEQGTATYRTKLCCLYCGGLGFVQQGPVDPPETADPAATPPLIAEPYIDVEFTHEE